MGANRKQVNAIVRKMVSRETIVQRIERTKAELASAKPRSRRHTQLEIRLRDLTVQQMKREIRSWKAA
jgi:hypothetical protein